MVSDLPQLMPWLLDLRKGTVSMASSKVWKAPKTSAPGSTADNESVHTQLPRFCVRRAQHLQWTTMLSNTETILEATRKQNSDLRWDIFKNLKKRKQQKVYVLCTKKLGKTSASREKDSSPSINGEPSGRETEQDGTPWLWDTQLQPHFWLCVFLNTWGFPLEMGQMISLI